MSHSMVKLPEKPMMPRLFDERVGYFTRSMYDYGRPEHKATERTYITRYRLEKKDPDAEISEPGQADRLLRRPGNAADVGAVREEGRRGLAAGVRAAQGSATPSSRGMRRPTIRTGARRMRATR